MGFVHQVVGPPPPGEVAASLPSLSDRNVADAVRLSEAYRELRRALLAMAGLSIFKHMSMAAAASAGVVATAREALVRARASLGGPLRSAHPVIRLRACALADSAKLLEGQVERVANGHDQEVALSVLYAVRKVLANASLPEAGLRHITSVSCAGYPGAAALVVGQGHAHMHDGAHGLANGHSQSRDVDHTHH